MLLLMLFHVPKASSLHAILTLFYIELKKKYKHQRNKSSTLMVASVLSSRWSEDDHLPDDHLQGDGHKGLDGDHEGECMTYSLLYACHTVV